MKKTQRIQMAKTYKDLNKNKGHEYGVRRQEKVLKHKTDKRSKEKLRKQLRDWY